MWKIVFLILWSKKLFTVHWGCTLKNYISVLYKSKAYYSEKHTNENTHYEIIVCFVGKKNTLFTMILWCNSGNIKKSSLLRISDPTAETGNDVEQATAPPPDETTSCLGHSVPALDSMVDSEDDSEPDGKGSLALRKDSFSGSTTQFGFVYSAEENIKTQVN